MKQRSLAVCRVCGIMDLDRRRTVVGLFFRVEDWPPRCPFRLGSSMYSDEMGGPFLLNSWESEKCKSIS